MNVGEIVASLKLDITAFREGIQNAGKVLTGLKEQAASASAAIGRASGQVESFGRALSGSYKPALQQATAAMDRYKSSATEAAAILGGVGVAITGAFAFGVKEATEMQSVIVDLNQVLQLTPDALATVTEELHALSRETGIADEELAKVLGDITKLGYQGAAAGEILATSARAAVAGRASVKSTGDTVTTILRAYNLEAGESGRVVDVLYQASLKGRMSFEEVATAIKGVIPVASQLGLGYEQIAAALATTTSVGYDAENSLMGLNMVMVRLTNPSKELQVALRAAGYESGQALVQARGLAGAIKFITQAAGEDQQALIQMAGGARAFKAVAALASNDAQLFAQKLRDIQNAGGAVNRALGNVMPTFATQLSRFTVTIKQLAEEFGGDFLAALTAVVQPIQAVAAALREIPPPIRLILSSVALLIAGMASLTASFILYQASVKAAGLASLSFLGIMSKLVASTLLSGVGLLIRGVTAAAGAIGAFLVAIGPWGWAALAAVAAAGGLYYAMTRVGSAARQASASAGALSDVTADQAKEAEKLASRYQELIGKTNRTAKENAELRAILDRLLIIAPGLIKSFDAEGRAATLYADAVKRAADRTRELHIEQLRVAAQRKMDLAQALSDAKEAAAANQERVRDLDKQVNRSAYRGDFWGGGLGGHESQLKRAQAEQVKLARSVLEAQKAYDDFIKAQTNASRPVVVPPRVSAFSRAIEDSKKGIKAESDLIASQAAIEGKYFDATAERAQMLKKHIDELLKAGVPRTDPYLQSLGQQYQQAAAAAEKQKDAAGKAAKATKDQLAATEETLRASIETATTDKERLGFQNLLAAHYAGAAHNSALDTREKAKNAAEEKKLRQEIAREGFANQERDLLLRKETATTYEKQRQAMVDLLALYRAEAKAPAIGRNLQVEAAKKAFAEQQGIAKLDQDRAEAAIALQQAQARGYAEQRNALVSLIAEKQRQIETDNTIGDLERAQQRTNVAGLREQLRVMKEQETQRQAAGEAELAGLRDKGYLGQLHQKQLLIAEEMRKLDAAQPEERGTYEAAILKLLAEEEAIYRQIEDDQISIRKAQADGYAEERKVLLDEIALDRQRLALAPQLSAESTAAANKLITDRKALMALNAQEAEKRIQQITETMKLEEAQGGQRVALDRQVIAQLQQWRAEAAAIGPEGEEAVARYDKAIAGLQVDIQKNAVTWNSIIRRAAQQWQSDLSTYFFDAFQGKLGSLTSLFRSLLNAIGQQIADWLASRAVQSFLGFLVRAVGSGIGGVAAGGNGITLGMGNGLLPSGKPLFDPASVLTGQSSAFQRAISGSLSSSAIAAMRLQPAGASAAAAAAAAPPVTINIHAIDTQTGIDFLMRNRHHVGLAIQAAARGNDITTRRR